MIGPNRVLAWRSELLDAIAESGPVAMPVVEAVSGVRAHRDRDSGGGFWVSAQWPHPANPAKRILEYISHADAQLADDLLGAIMARGPSQRPANTYPAVA
jgi:hypothetical protein